MLKNEQQKINDFVKRETDKAYNAFMERMNGNGLFEIEPLYSCKAKVYKYDNYILLLSYDTFVAFIDIKSKIFVDFLRLEYGYTATSAQHIAKFRKKYANYFNENNIYTWRAV